MAVLFRMYIIRHGETEWNRTRRIQGHLDVPLNETGIKQAGLVAEAMKGIPLAKAFSSDLQRASKTAELILRYHPDVLLEKNEALRERCMGELQGEITPSKKPAPSLETTPALIARCQAWYTRSIVHYMTSRIKQGLPLGEPQNILVVSHGGWITTLLTTLVANDVVTCGKGAVIGHCVNTGVSIVEYTVGENRSLVGDLVQYSDIEHLRDEDLRHQEVNVDELVDQGKKP
ncbi:phosphoglycerate mutase-like protein [Gyrodon lividus]|nr:phosphoglycerate mutase-like protein [Gyrodon lividus]